MKRIEIGEFETYFEGPLQDFLGTQPRLEWLEIDSLRIDPAYQREVLRNGARNVAKIAKNFHWSLFGVVVVASIGGGLYAIVDGQHRTIAAALRSIVLVPCAIIEADAGLQAKAFAAINGAVTKMSPLQIFRAELAAGDPAAVALRDAATAGGVTICPYPVPSNKMGRGETLAIGTLRQCLKTYGAEHLALSLRCLTNSSRNAGMVTEATIKAICNVLSAEPSWARDEPRLLAAMRKFDFEVEMHAVGIDAKARRMNVASALAMRLFDFFDAELGA